VAPAGLDGLSAAEAMSRLRRVGLNRWVVANRWAWLRDGLALLADPMAVMLALAAILYFLLGEPRDATVLALALIPVLGVDVLLEARSRAALAKLAQTAEPIAEVVRDGRVSVVALEQVVPGDLLVLREGHVVAADGVVEWAANLAIDEASLTGESEPQTKRTSSDLQHAPLDARFFAGSVVAAGHGFGRVLTTGPATQYGGIAALVAQAAPSPSPLQRRAGRLVRQLGGVAILVAAGLVAVGLVRGESWTAALLGAVSLAMAAIPEEFPIVLTLFLSVGAWRLASRGMLVRRLASVETLGSTTVICTDKTGTLTRGEFQLTEHLVLDPAMSDHDFWEAAILACERHPVDAMEQAIRMSAERLGVSMPAISKRWTLERDYDFDPVGKHMSHVWRASAKAGAFVIAAKGAVEGVLAHCRIDAAGRTHMLEATDRLATRGLRVLAVAGRYTDHLGADRAEDECDLTAYGLLGFQDPLRPEVAGAVNECQRAGIRVKMITGDYPLTAHAVAEAAGIRHEDAWIVTGDELTVLGDAERDDRIDRAAIFARISPQQKYLIVDGLKRAGAIVAMTGDGVNDAPALRRADIGIAMGQRGTDVARATADLVLLDDNFASIVATVREGRHILQNIQRAFLYLIAFHVPIVVLAVIPPLAGLPLALFPVHLVWLELIVHPASALVFQAEPGSSSIMRQPPRDPAAPLLPRGNIVRSATAGGLLAVSALAVYWWQIASGGEWQARALAMIDLLAGYQILLFVERIALPGIITRLPRTLAFWLVWVASAASLALILSVPQLAYVFRVARPAPTSIAIAIMAGVLAVGWRLVVRRGASDIQP
jgi:Ca2+-transporting ATPase